MANIKVSELNEATSLNNSDVFMVVQNNESKKANLSTVLNKTFYKEKLNFSDYSNLETLAHDVYNNKDKDCEGTIGNEYATNLRTLLGNPNIGNYVNCYFEVVGGTSRTGVIRVTAYGEYTSNVSIGYVIYDAISAQWTGWKSF